MATFDVVVNAKDIYTTLVLNQDKTVVNGVVEFVFQEEVDAVGLYANSTLLTASQFRAGIDLIPASNFGVPLPDKTFVFLPVRAKTVQVFGVSGTVSCWGYKY